MANEMQAVTKMYDVLKWLIPQVSKLPRSHAIDFERSKQAFGVLTLVGKTLAKARTPEYLVA